MITTPGWVKGRPAMDLALAGLPTKGFVPLPVGCKVAACLDRAYHPHSIPQTVSQSCGRKVVVEGQGWLLGVAAT